MKKYTHIKTGNIYNIFDMNIINATNKDNNKIMVLYTDNKQIFVREKQEFLKKFKEK